MAVFGIDFEMAQEQCGHMKPQLSSASINFRSTGKLFASIAAVLMLWAGCRTVADKEVSLPSSVLRLRGKPCISFDEGMTWNEPKRWQTVAAGCQIKTPADSVIDLALGDEVKSRVRAQIGGWYVSDPQPVNILRVQPESLLNIRRSITKGRGKSGVIPDIRLDLSAGRIVGRVSHLPDGANYEIHFAKGIIYVQRALFSLNTDGNIEVVEGNVTLVANSGSVTNEIAAGHKYDINTGLTSGINERVIVDYAPVPTFPPPVWDPPRSRF